MALLGKNKQKFPNPFPQEALRVVELGSWKWEGKDDFK